MEDESAADGADPAAEAGDAFDLLLSGTGFCAHEGRTVRVAVAGLSCGYYLVGQAWTTVRHGAFTVSFEDLLSPYMSADLFLLVGRSDGECRGDGSDLLFKIQGAEWSTIAYGTSGDLSLSVTPASLEPAGGWECFLFEDPSHGLQ